MFKIKSNNDLIEVETEKNESNSIFKDSLNNRILDTEIMELEEGFYFTPERKIFQKNNQSSNNFKRNINKNIVKNNDEREESNRSNYAKKERMYIVSEEVIQIQKLKKLIENEINEKDNQIKKISLFYNENIEKYKLELIELEKKRENRMKIHKNRENSILMWKRSGEKFSENNSSSSIKKSTSKERNESQDSLFNNLKEKFYLNGSKSEKRTYKDKENCQIFSNYNKNEKLNFFQNNNHKKKLIKGNILKFEENNSKKLSNKDIIVNDKKNENLENNSNINNSSKKKKFVKGNYRLLKSNEKNIIEQNNIQENLKQKIKSKKKDKISPNMRKHKKYFYSKNEENSDNSKSSYKKSFFKNEKNVNENFNQPFIQFNYDSICNKKNTPKNSKKNENNFGFSIENINMYNNNGKNAKKVYLNNDKAIWKII